MRRHGLRPSDRGLLDLPRRLVPCFQGTGCQAGKCLDCPSTFEASVGPTSAAATRGLVASNGELYLAPTLPSGDDTKAAPVEVDGCFGTACDHDVLPLPAIGPSAVRSRLGGPGAEVVAACGGFQPSMSDPGAALVVGGGADPLATWQLHENGSPGTDVLVGRGRSRRGVDGLAAPAPSSPPGWIVYGDLTGKHVCASTAVFGATAEGAAMATDGSKLYAAATDDSGISIAVFSAGACDPASCACAPTKTLGPIVVGGNLTDVGAMLFAGGHLYVSGFASDDGSSYYAYVAIVSVTDGALGNVYRGAPAATLDEFVSLASDGTLVYAAGYEGATAIGDVSAAAAAVVVGLTPDLDSTPMFKVHPKAAHSVVGVATTPSYPGSYFAYLDETPGVAVVHCKSGSFACP